MRENLLSQLVKDVLGPHEGPYESLTFDPMNEYITGVLAPRGASADRDVYDDAEVLGPGVERQSEIGEDSGDADLLASALVKPALSPKVRPNSIGLSFSVQRGDELPQIKMCVTWSKYSRYEENKIRSWRRSPRIWVSPVLKIGEQERKVFYLSGDGARLPNSERAEVSLWLVSVKLKDSTWHASVYFVNEAKMIREYPTTDECVFQPQIRISLQEGTEIIPHEAEVRDELEDQELDFLYRNRRTMGRGHVCSAVWKSIDPERINPNSKIERSRPHAPPFYWVDGEFVDQKTDRKTREEFTCPDIRTEFVPIISVESPMLDWDKSFGQLPKLAPADLAEAWSEAEIRASLNPLVEGYRKWAENVKKGLLSIDSLQESVAERILKRSEDVLRRMKAGVDLLISDTEARLAFCFANKAIALQAGWQRIDLKWYPFQLAFILMTLESVAGLSSPDRSTCDLLWVGTGAGKTEAYLAVSAFTMAYRRRRAIVSQTDDLTGGGVAVITRYTLRLLTIQQFRRTLNLITATEYLRVQGLGSDRPIGWRPRSCNNKDDFIWGSTRFSVGLWVGGAVTPNRLGNMYDPTDYNPISGAISILKGASGEGEPAQILRCPACDTIIAIPKKGLEPGHDHLLHIITHCPGSSLQRVQQILATTPAEYRNIHLSGKTVRALGLGHFVISLKVSCQAPVTSHGIDEMWSRIEEHFNKNGTPLDLVPARPSRLGYFILHYTNRRGTSKERDFEIYCPNPDCPLNSETTWAEGVPIDAGTPSVIGPISQADRSSRLETGQHNSLRIGSRELRLPDGMVFRTSPEWCRSNQPGVPLKSQHMFLSKRIPIPALTVDEQIYCHPPSFIVATVDKFARLPYEGRCASIFGNVEFYHAHFGYYRPYLIPFIAGPPAHREHPPGADLFVKINAFRPPELIIQDELHLIEGPLGSMVGLYETAVDALCKSSELSAKYIASTATVKKAEQQVGSLFVRRLCQFPPVGVDSDDRFGVRLPPNPHPLDETRPGQLYAGICAPGRGPLEPIVRIWSRLLETAKEQASIDEKTVDYYWTLVGFFNAIRELAGTRSLYGEDLPERMSQISGKNRRDIPIENMQELSSNVNSTDLPTILSLLQSRYPDAPDALLTTSMFGTGVDIKRLALMVVHGQPKTTSSYIQATGRVGRQRGALVVTFYRASRPRDLSHYEFFAGYHRALHRFVEDVTVAPFSKGALERGGGPTSVAILRNERNTSASWGKEDSAPLMSSARHSPEVKQIPTVFETRSQKQPEGRKPPSGETAGFLDSQLDHWRQTSMRDQKLLYVEYFDPKSSVVLGDPRHQDGKKLVVFKNAPQSMREVESTAGFQTEEA